MPSPSPKLKVEKTRIHQKSHKHREPLTHLNLNSIYRKRREYTLNERILGDRRVSILRHRNAPPLVSDRVILFLCTGSFVIGMIAVISTILFCAFIVTNLNIASFEARVTFHQKEPIPPKQMPEYCLLPRGVQENDKIGIQLNTLEGFEELREWTLNKLNSIGERKHVQFQLSSNSLLAIYFAKPDVEIKSEDIAFLVHAGAKDIVVVAVNGTLVPEVSPQNEQFMGVRYHFGFSISSEQRNTVEGDEQIERLSDVLISLAQSK